MNRKKIEASFFRYLFAVVTYGIIFIFVYILYVIFKRGFHSISWSMISEEPKGGFYMGNGGGVLNAIVGSFYIATGATILAVIIGLPVVLLLNVHLVKYKKLVGSIRFLLDILWGIPSIIYGAFAFVVMTWLHLQASLLAGIITVGFLIVPIFARAFDEVVRTTAFGLLEASHSLGSNHTEISYLIYFKRNLPGFITAFLLAFGRAIGDAASVIFTAGYTDHVPMHLSDPAATLPLSIFFQLSSPIASVKERAFASTLLLTIIILVISIISRIIYSKIKRYAL